MRLRLILILLALLLPTACSQTAASTRPADAGDETSAPADAIVAVSLRPAATILASTAVELIPPTATPVPT
ncbi:MAG: hypothetical protein D6775_05720, partial [Caldilineae bacterium]